jgi:hypothetical protein
MGCEIRRSKISFFILSVTCFPLRFLRAPVVSGQTVPERLPSFSCATRMVSEGRYPITLGEACHASIETRLAPKKSVSSTLRLLFYLQVVREL